MPEIPSLEELLKKGVHFGHKESKWHPGMEPFVHTSRNKVHIIDLLKTQDCLKQALAFVTQAVQDNKIVLLVGTKKAIKDIVRQQALDGGLPYVTERWLGGTITNFGSIQGLIRKLQNLEKQESQSDYENKYTKKERLEFSEEKERLLKMIGGIRELTRIPDILFVTDLRNERTAVREAKRKNLKIVAIADTNTDPAGLDYIIPANDDSIKSVELITRLLLEAVKEGRAKAQTAEPTVAVGQKQATTEDDDKPETVV